MVHDLFESVVQGFVLFSGIGESAIVWGYYVNVYVVFNVDLYDIVDVYVI